MSFFLFQMSLADRLNSFEFMSLADRNHRTIGILEVFSISKWSLQFHVFHNVAPTCMLMDAYYTNVHVVKNLHCVPDMGPYMDTSDDLIFRTIHLMTLGRI